MKTEYLKYNDVVDLLKAGGEIFTSRGSAPYKPLYYKLYFGNDFERIHPSTVKKLIRDGVINGSDSKHCKYSLKN